MKTGSFGGGELKAVRVTVRSKAASNDPVRHTTHGHKWMTVGREKVPNTLSSGCRESAPGQSPWCRSGGPRAGPQRRACGHLPPPLPRPLLRSRAALLRQWPRMSRAGKPACCGWSRRMRCIANSHIVVGPVGNPRRVCSEGEIGHGAVTHLPLSRGSTTCVVRLRTGSSHVCFSCAGLGRSAAEKDALRCRGATGEVARNTSA